MSKPLHGREATCHRYYQVFSEGWLAGNSGSTMISLMAQVRYIRDPLEFPISGPEHASCASAFSDADGENPMRFLLLLVLASFAMIMTSHVQAQQPGPVPDGCFRDLLSGKISCPPLGGDIIVNLSGQAVCGKGRCVRELSGKVTCSSQPGGQATQDVNGKVMCVGGCEEASASNCKQLN